MDANIKYRFKTNAFVFIMVSFISILVSCDKKQKDNVAYLMFANNSEKSVFLFYSIAYPDSSLDKTNHGCSNVMPHTTCKCLNRLGWNYSNEYHELLFFVFDSDTVNKYGDNHMQNKWILKKYKYSEQELKQMNWTVTYP